jgi:hypothetical protein
MFEKLFQRKLKKSTFQINHIFHTFFTTTIENYIESKGF